MIKLEELKESFKDISDLKLKLVHQITNNQFHASLLDSFKSNQNWIKQCVHRPSDIELELNAINELLEGYGVEAIQFENYHVDNYWYGTVGLFINMGDTYNPTIVYDVENKEYLLTSWGDFYEAIETEINERINENSIDDD